MATNKTFIRVPRPKLPGRAPRPAVSPAPEPVSPPPKPAVSHRDGNGGAHERVVIPRQQRGEAPDPALDIELREVRYGTTSRGSYLRTVLKTRDFTRVERGHIEATEVSSEPVGTVERAVASVKSAVLGAPLATSQAIHERLSKFKALAVLGSDPLSSSAYATEEALIVLALAGSGALIYSLPIALVVAALMAIVVISYRQTQKAYPSGGGAYIVAHDNLGRYAGLIAGSSLIVDYVLLVSVSVAAGVAAVTSAVPELYDWRVVLAIVIIVLFTLGNLRGIRESGTIFAAPTYFFILAMGGTVAYGVIRVLIGDAPGSLLHSAPPKEEVIATQGLTLWLILRAFSSGGAALTGVEAMSNNIPNFRPPESENARKTLLFMAVIAIYLFIGITFLTSRFGLVPTEEETLVSQLGRVVLGGGIPYYGYQAATALVLFLAANTSFYDFPMLSAIMARDKYMPRQFSFRGDRLAYTTGIVVLAGLATLLIVAFQADTTRLIPLYAVGVFVSFTLSQSGMVRHWLRLKEPGWRASLLMNGFGAIATGVVAVIIGATKFVHGAWISLLIMAILVLAFAAVRRHYAWFGRCISVDGVTPAGAGPYDDAGRREPGRHVIVPVDDINKITLGAVQMAREMSPRVTAVHVSDDRERADQFRARWHNAVPGVPLLVLESPYRAFVAPIVALLRRLRDREPDGNLSVVLPTFATRHWWERLLHNQDVLRLRGILKDEPGIGVVVFTYELR